MNDIVEKLRAAARVIAWSTPSAHTDLCSEAAATIERLTRERDKARAETIAEVKALREALLACRERAEIGGRRFEKAVNACDDISKIATCALLPEGWQASLVAKPTAELAKAREALAEIARLDQYPVTLGGGRKEPGPFARIACAALPPKPEELQS